MKSHVPWKASSILVAPVFYFILSATGAILILPLVAV